MGARRRILRARMMSSADDAAKFWYETPSSKRFRASIWWFGYIVAFVITGMHARIALPISTRVSRTIAEQPAPNRMLLVE
jgi:hypothetical protein